eukprot:CAMPEP_0115518618 /NCGR_PEP_ID=MMETSP0271-20121206/77987_1 /TAXON_ID=71861 /ORGANISM="Scrippsiella trochoidea, Strain CCMP3099" /LENGTH=39 /DNA_ID= /DNA_START= /DNA_END= /DNA_ORIENTATION=
MPADALPHASTNAVEEPLTKTPSQASFDDSMPVTCSATF